MAQAALALIGDDNPEQLYELRREEAERKEQDPAVQGTEGQYADQSGSQEAETLEQHSQEENLATVSTTVAVTPVPGAARPPGNPRVQGTKGNQQNQPRQLGTTRVESFVQERQTGPNRGTPEPQHSQEKKKPGNRVNHHSSDNREGGRKATEEPNGTEYYREPAKPARGTWHHGSGRFCTGKGKGTQRGNAQATTV